jgi:hypothetical protein
MAKDPAVLFYTSDFISGTYTMTDEQVGKYIRLLCLQHQKSRLTEKDMLYICKTYDVDIWCKFDKDDAGYFNVRMDNEGTKRKNYSESRKNNRKPNHMKNICSTYEKHMENENENRDINKDVVKDVVKEKKTKREKFTIPTVEEITTFAETEMIGSVELPEKFFNYYESKGWLIGNVSMKNWKAAYKNWTKNEKQYEAVKGTNQHRAETKTEQNDRLYRDFGKELTGGKPLPDIFELCRDSEIKR